MEPLDIAEKMKKSIEENETDTCRIWSNYGKVRLYVKRSGYSDAGHIDIVEMKAFGDRPGNQDLLNKLIKKYAPSC